MSLPWIPFWIPTFTDVFIATHSNNTYLAHGNPNFKSGAAKAPKPARNQLDGVLDICVFDNFTLADEDLKKI